MRILHLLHRSVPGTHGYAIRSRQIVLSQREKGLEPIVVTSPSQSPQGELDSERSEVIEGVRYFRTGSAALPPSVEVEDRSPTRAALRVLQNVRLYETALHVARQYRPAVIHAHSPFTCGIVGNRVGRRIDIPTIYEVRGIWEDSHVGRRKFGERSIRYRAVRFLENMAMNGADACCVISEALRGEVASRGVDPEKISIVPNGVDVTRFRPGNAPEELIRRFGLENAITMGYIGSFFHYEGLDLLVDVMRSLAGEFPRVRLFLVGGGELEQTLKSMTVRDGLRNRVIFVGTVPHQQIADYYRLCDLMILPRRLTRETRLVTPLKPMEIMAMGKALLASDIGGHREMVRDGLNGLLFESENVEDLAAKCRLLITDGTLRRNLGFRARTWVEENRNWNVLTERYLSLYARLAVSGGNEMSA